MARHLKVLKSLEGKRVRKNDASGKKPEYAVVAADVGTGEELPLLVEAATWLPIDLPLRWVVFHRRYEVAASTIRNDLAALRHLYRWADRLDAFPCGLEGRLSSGGTLTYDELTSLAAALRAAVAVRKEGMAEGASVGRIAHSVRLFLQWAVVPANRGEPGAPPSDLAQIERQIDTILKPLSKGGGAGRRQETPADEIERIERVIAPVITASGRIVSPLRWHKDNPFKRTTRLRNWLMWCLAVDEGLRLGEILGLYVSDFPDVAGTPTVRVIGRADNPLDKRKSKPQAKTLDRVLPASPRVQAALRAYLTSRPPVGRRSGGSPFLITTARGNPLGESAAGSIVKVLRGADLASELCTFHGLRHAWAEDLAEALFAKNRTERETVIAKLRVLGGWALTSRMPAHYADGAIARDAMRDMRERQSRLFNFVEVAG